jgi:glycosyltransferase involved in cell wall biosynthesis
MVTKLNIAFITNICAHYRVKTFEALAGYQNTDYFFFSAGDEWYWQQQHGVQTGNFSYTYLPGVRIGQTRITPTLPWHLWRGQYDVYLKCINGRFALPITYAIARLRRKPFILWTGIWTRIQTRVHRWFFPLTRYIYQHADAIVVYGEHVKRYLISEGVPGERIFVAAHAVDNPAYNRAVSDGELTALRQQLNIADRQKVVLYLGRLEAVKGLDYLIEAFASLPNREENVLVLAGTGAEDARLKQLVQARGVAKHVRFAGYTPVEQTLAYYALATLCVLPSVTVSAGKETWGLVVNEAMNQGTPVIATDAVGATAGGLVQNGVNGLVVPERDSTALAQAIQKIFENPLLHKQMSQQAKSIIVNWDNEQMVLGFRQAIDYVTDKNK